MSLGRRREMMNSKRLVLLAIVTVALVSAALPVLGLRAVGAAGNAAEARLRTPLPPVSSPVRAQEPVDGQRLENGQYLVRGSETGPIMEGDLRDRAKELGIFSIPATESMRMNKEPLINRVRKQVSGIEAQSNEPAILAPNAAFSAAIATTIGGRDTQFDDIELLADWDG